MHNSKNLDITFELCKHGYSSGQGNFVTPTLHRHSSHILLTKNAVFQSRLGPHSLIFGHPASRAVPSSSTQEIFKGRCPLQPFCCHHFANSKAKHQITYNIYNSIKLLIILLVYIMDANHIYIYISTIYNHYTIPSNYSYSHLYGWLYIPYTALKIVGASQNPLPHCRVASKGAKAEQRPDPGGPLWRAPPPGQSGILLVDDARMSMIWHYLAIL